MKTGIELIAEERGRQVAKEGWSEAHDDGHSDGALAGAAAGYALTSREQSRGDEGPFAFTTNDIWPEGWEFKPKDRLSNLVRAGALIAAEIDRVQREDKMFASMAEHHKRYAQSRES